MKVSKDESILRRPNQSGLPFSIEYWKDGEWMIYPKKCIGNGGNKNVMSAVDLVGKRLFVRIKPRSECPQKTIDEAKLIESFAGERGIIQNYRTSYYSCKNKPNKMKFHIIQEQYKGTLNLLYGERKISLEEIKLVMVDIMSGLNAVHKKSLLHYDLKPANILVQVDKNTNRVTGAVLCDFGETSDGSNNIPPLSKEELSNAQRREVDHLLGIFQSLHRKEKIELPEYISELFGVPDLPSVRELGLTPKPAATAEEALEEILKYSKSLS